ncbi:mCG1027126, partial [Mus musculus]
QLTACQLWHNGSGQQKRSFQISSRLIFVFCNQEINSGIKREQLHKCVDTRTEGPLKALEDATPKWNISYMV